MRGRVMVAALAAAVVLGGCAPYVAQAPIGKRQPRVCEYVRDQVKEGALPLELALRYYADCGPFRGAA